MTTSIQLFMIYMTSKLPQTSARHPQNDQDTHRHHPDTPQTKAFLGIRDHWKKRQYLSWQDFFTFLPTDLVSIPPQTHSDSIQTPSDTIQKPPGIGVFYAIQGTRIKDNIWVSWPNIICLPTHLVLIHPQTLSDPIQTPRDTVQTHPDKSVFM